MTQEPQEPWVPLLVVDASHRKSWGRLPAITVIATVVFVLATALLAYLGAFPWLPQGAPFYFLVFQVAFWKFVLIPTGIVLATIVARHVGARTGRVEFFVDRIAIEKHEGAIEVPWSEIASFRDGSSDYVELVRQDARLGARLTVPTPSEHDRVSVLALLTGRGIPRSE